MNSKAPSNKIKKLLNKIHCSDCLEFMNELPKESVDLIVTSPPYNIKNSSGNGLKDSRGGKWANASLVYGYETHDDCMPHEEYVTWQRQCLEAMLRILKDDGAIFYNHKWRVQKGLLQDRTDIVDGFPVRQIIIWKRKGGINFNPGYFLPTYEVIYLITKENFYLRDKANAIGDIWEIKQEHQNPHPAPFPIELVNQCISSCNADIVFDPFMGSGTTAVAAIENGVDWFGCDSSQAYCDMANQRIRQIFHRAVND